MLITGVSLIVTIFAVGHSPMDEKTEPTEVERNNEDMYTYQPVFTSVEIQEDVRWSGCRKANTIGMCKVEKKKR